MKAIGYVRVSTEGQAADGVSLDAQRAKIEAWCIANDADLVGIFNDAGISGTVADRPGLLAAMAAVRKGDALVVYSLSRLARSTKQTILISEQLDKVGADLVSLSEKIDTTTAAGKMVFRMLAVLAEFERDQISERTKTALKYKKSQQERVGSIPYGYQLADDGVHLDINQDEQEIISLIKSLHGEGYSLRKIANRLTHDGYKSRGNGWHPQSIKNILEAA